MNDDSSWLWQCSLDEVCVLYLWLVAGQHVYEITGRAIVARYTKAGYAH